MFWFLTSVRIFACKTVSQKIILCTLSFGYGIRCIFYIQRTLFFVTWFYINEKQKKTNPVFVRLKQTKIVIPLMSNHNDILHFWKSVNNSIATKLCSNLLNNRKRIVLFCQRHNSMTKLCRSILKCENKQKILAEKNNAQLCSALKWECA